MSQTEELVIRPLTAGDKTQWRELWAAYLAFYGTTLGAKVFDASFARMIDPAEPRFQGLVAELDGELIGLVHFLIHGHNWRLEDVVYLQDLFVVRHVRNRGVGRHLIEAVYKAADAAGTPSVYWMTQDFNVDARTLYDQVAEVTPFIKYQRPL